MSAPERIHARHHVATFVALLVLATASLLLSRLIHSAALGVTLSLAIAAAKALLVLAVFMHLIEQPLRTRLALLSAALLLLTLVILTAADVATRGPVSEPRQQLGPVGGALSERGMIERSSMLRIFPAGLGIGLCTLWLIARVGGATSWLAWLVAIAGLLTLASVGLVPDRAPAIAAGLCLVTLGAGELGLWAVAWWHGATPWLTWWTLVFAVLSLGVALPLILQGAIDRLRGREVI